MQKYILYIFISLLFSTAVFAEDLTTSPLEKLNQLSQSKEWLSLGHYRQILGGSFESEIDDPKFFLAPTGKTDPTAELIATYISLNKIQCSFPARFAWLKEQGFEVRDEVKCQDFEEWLSLLDPHSLTLIFPSSYLNNPSSMFGHLFLRVDGESADTSGLLGYGISYSAETGEDDGMSFIVKGLAGGYGGYYSILPYYKLVAGYNEIENRDIWEYPLELTPAEVKKVLAHLWELRGIRTDYYFLDENCSYQLLSLLEIANPKYALKDETRAWVLPVDLIRLLRTKSLIKSESYRPSLKSQLLYEASLLDKNHSKTQELETEISYANYQLRRDYDPELANKLNQLLIKKNSLSLNQKTVPTPALPESGHKTMRFGLSAGLIGDKFVSEYRFRAAYHDLLDPPVGFQEYSQIQFMNLQLSRSEIDELRLEQLDIFDVISLTPFRSYLNVPSWKAHLSLKRELFEKGQRSLLLEASAGPGITTKITENSAFYLLTEPVLLAGPALSENYALGIRPSVGTIIDPLSSLRLHFFGRYRNNFAGSTSEDWQWGSEARLSLTADLAVRFELLRELTRENYQSTGIATFELYF
jgi:hypothetical protein